MCRTTISIEGSFRSRVVLAITPMRLYIPVSFHFPQPNAPHALPNSPAPGAFALFSRSFIGNSSSRSTCREMQIQVRSQAGHARAKISRSAGTQDSTRQAGELHRAYTYQVKQNWFAAGCRESRRERCQACWPCILFDGILQATAAG